jgi:hypothetical protein
MDWTLNVGSLVVAGTVVFSAGGFYYASRFESRRMRDDINDIKGDLKALNKVVMDVAVQNTRLDNTDRRLSAMETRWDEVRRGEGLITR